MARRGAAVLVVLAALAASPALAGGKGCPPGLAKKAVPCVPPGQAAKWTIGERLPISTPWYMVTDWERFGLPEPLDGSRYVRVDDQILRVAIATGIVLEAVGLID